MKHDVSQSRTGWRTQRGHEVENNSINKPSASFSTVGEPLDFKQIFLQQCWTLYCKGTGFPTVVPAEMLVFRQHFWLSTYMYFSARKCQRSYSTRIQRFIEWSLNLPRARDLRWVYVCHHNARLKFAGLKLPPPPRLCAFKLLASVLRTTILAMGTYHMHAAGRHTHDKRLSALPSGPCTHHLIWLSRMCPVSSAMNAHGASATVSTVHRRQHFPSVWGRHYQDAWTSENSAIGSENTW